MNPCPCGYLGDARRKCRCQEKEIHKYRARVSGPLLDRLDIHLEAPAVNYEDLASDLPVLDSRTIRQQVSRARVIQAERFAGRGLYVNSQMSSGQVRKWAPLGPGAQKLLASAMKQLGFSARAYTRIIKLARTIADLEAAADIAPPHLAEAISYRALDRNVLD
jgi:magnesium chelatase family protein